jgi:hypothetical protein
MPALPRLAGPSGTCHAPTRRAAIRASIQASRHRVTAPARGGAPSAERRAAPKATALGKTAKTTATAGQKPDGKADYRQDRYRARAWLSTVTALPRVSACGRVSVIEGGEVLLKVSTVADGTRRAGFGGLSTCGSVWACPVCSAKVAAERIQEVESLLAWNAARGGSVALATFTVSHNAGHGFKSLREALRVGWKHIADSGTWKRTRKEIGMDGYVKAIDVTHTNTGGWHPHIHVLMAFDGPVSQEMVSDWADELYGLWSRGLAKIGMTASRKHGVDLRLGTGALDGLGQYLNKLTYETAGGRFKKGRKNDDGIVSRTPFEILDDAIATGLESDWALWFEFERASKGLRQIGWSQHLKERVGVEDKSNEEIAEEDEKGETVAIVTPRAWKKLYWHASELLTVLEQGGPEVALGWMDYRGLSYELGRAFEGAG